MENPLICPGNLQRMFRLHCTSLTFAQSVFGMPGFDDSCLENLQIWLLVVHSFDAPHLAMESRPCSYKVWLRDSWDATYKLVHIEYGRNKPIHFEVRRTYFLDGHVPMCGVDTVGLPREIISHMDSARFYRMLKITKGKLGELLSSSDLQEVEKTCFLLSNAHNRA